MKAGDVRLAPQEVPVGGIDGSRMDLHQRFIVLGNGFFYLCQFKDINKPLVKDDEVLVRVHAASVNRLDWHLMIGSPYISRLQAGLR